MIIVTKREDITGLRRLQHDAFHKAPPGSWFEIASEWITSAADGEPVLALGLDSGAATVFDKNGQPIANTVEKVVDGSPILVEKGVVTRGHRGWLVDMNAAAGCVPCVAEVDGARYGAGLTIVAGKGNTGKTPFIHALACHLAPDGYACIRFGEPLSGYTTDFDGLIQDVAQALLSHKIIVIDSLKDVIGAAGGNATSGGISRGAFQLLSDLGALAATRGAMVIAALNPTSNDQKIVELIEEAVRSNSTSLVVPEGDTNWRIFTRTGEGQRRVEHTLTMEYGEHSVATVRSKRARNESDAKTTNIQSTVSAGEMSAVVRRLTNSN